MPTDYQGNSNKGKEPKKDIPPKKLEKVVTGEVIRKKRSIGMRFKNIFFGGSAKDAAKYVTADVLLPALRNLVYDMGAEGLKRTLFGPGYLDRRRGYYDYRPTIRYDNPYRSHYERPYGVNLPDQPRRYSPDPRDIRDPRAINANSRSDRLTLDQLIIVHRPEAEKVVETLIDCIDKYDVATVADLNELIGAEISHTDQKWGWTSLNSVEIRQVVGGYLIDLPSPEPI